jgi:diguanylate cyclase (GGDEF)-like protein
MTFDVATLVAVSSLIAVICGASFILNTSFTRNDPTGRTWSLGFISSIIVAAGYGVVAVNPDAWWALVVGNVAFIGSFGALWSGARLHNGRSSLIWIGAAAASVVGIVTIVQIPTEGVWAGSAVLWVALASFSVLGGAELQRGRLRRNLNGRSLALVLWLNAAYVLARTIVFVVEGQQSNEFQAMFNSGVASVVTMTVVISTTITVSVLRTEVGGDRAVGDLTDGILSRAGVLSATAFEQTARDHLERAEWANAGVALIGADIDKLPEVNTAFGRIAGDDAIAAFAQSLRRSAPVMAEIGHPSAGRFLILAAVASETEALRIAEAIQTAIVDDPLPETQRIRLTASIGVADVFDQGYALDDLVSAVTVALDEAKAQGGNHISVG